MKKNLKFLCCALVVFSFLFMFACENNQPNNEKQMEYTVTYIFNDGSERIQNDSVYLNQKVMQISDPTRDGYVFLGWFKGDSVGTNISTEKFDFMETLVQDDIYLYAKWQELKLIQEAPKDFTFNVENYNIEIQCDGDNLEYSINGEDFFDSPIFSNLKSEQQCILSVRAKETDTHYASGILSKKIVLAPAKEDFIVEHTNNKFASVTINPIKQDANYIYSSDGENYYSSNEISVSLFDEIVSVFVKKKGDSGFPDSYAVEITKSNNLRNDKDAIEYLTVSNASDLDGIEITTYTNSDGLIDSLSTNSIRIDLQPNDSSEICASITLKTPPNKTNASFSVKVIQGKADLMGNYKGIEYPIIVEDSDDWQSECILQGTNLKLSTTQTTTLFIDNITWLDDDEISNISGLDQDWIINASYDCWDGQTIQLSQNFDSNGLYGDSNKSIKMDIEYPNDIDNSIINLWLNRPADAFGVKLNIKTINNINSIKILSYTLESDKGDDWTKVETYLENNEWITLCLGYYPNVSDKVLLQLTSCNDYIIFVDNIIPISEDEYKDYYLSDADDEGRVSVDVWDTGWKTEKINNFGVSGLLGDNSLKSVKLDVKKNPTYTENCNMNIWIERPINAYGVKVDVKLVHSGSTNVRFTNTIDDWSSNNYVLNTNQWTTLYLGYFPGEGNTNKILLNSTYSGDFIMYFDNITAISEEEYKNAVGNDVIKNLSFDYWSGVVVGGMINLDNVGLNGTNSYQSLQVDVKLPTTSASENMNIWLNRKDNSFGYKVDVKVVCDEGTTVSIQSSTQESDKGQDWTIQNFTLTNGEWVTVYVGYYPNMTNKVLLQPTFTGDFKLYLDNIIEITENEYKDNIKK